jgi:hypothetical protein
MPAQGSRPPVTKTATTSSSLSALRRAWCPCEANLKICNPAQSQLQSRCRLLAVARQNCCSETSLQLTLATWLIVTSSSLITLECAWCPWKANLIVYTSSKIQLQSCCSPPVVARQSWRSETGFQQTPRYLIDRTSFIVDPNLLCKMFLGSWPDNLPPAKKSDSNMQWSGRTRPSKLLLLDFAAAGPNFTSTAVTPSSLIQISCVRCS